MFFSPILPLIYCVTLSKSLGISGLQGPHWSREKTGTDDRKRPLLARQPVACGLAGTGKEQAQLRPHLMGDARLSTVPVQSAFLASFGRFQPHPATLNFSPLPNARAVSPPGLCTDSPR